MKKILFIILAAIVFFSTSCRKDYLDVTSPSAFDEDFVFSAPEEAYKTMIGCYDLFRHSLHYMYYDLDIAGSDSEWHPEAYDAQLLRHNPCALYFTENSIDYNKPKDMWADMFRLSNLSNMIMTAIAKKSEYQNAVSAGEPNMWTHLYGEAAVMRAFSYHSLIRYFGDVPYFQEPIFSTAQTDSATLISRDIIYDGEIANLRKVEPLMYRLGENGITAERFSRSFAQGLIGRISLFAGGYGLRRTDFDYGDVTFDQIGIERWNARYVRLTDYKKYYEIAKIYLEALVQNPGSAYLITNDPRGTDFNNPFQYNFQYNMDLEVSPESLYESGFTRAAGGGEIPYAYGRPSDGAGANAYPCKSYGQSRIHAAFYYGDFEPQDMRRDVTVAVTSNSGSCSEILIDFTPGSRSKGGLVNNKWDESRMKDPYTQGQRNSGVNWVHMRMSDAILMLAEVYAELGDEGPAKNELKKVRSRAFREEDQTTFVTNYINSLSDESLKAAIMEERKLEFAGEGLRRYDMIRSGTMPEMIKRIRDMQTAMVEGLETQGYYTFPNGNTISNYIYVKKVNVADLGMTKMLITQCNVPESDPTWPVRFPGWRGNCDLWGAQGFSSASGNRNIAIQGLFRYINPDGPEAAALEADGYVKTEWGINIVKVKDEYTSFIFRGYPDEYYNEGVPPRYMSPLSSETIRQSNGFITNGYGFAQE